MLYLTKTIVAFVVDVLINLLEIILICLKCSVFYFE